MASPPADYRAREIEIAKRKRAMQIREIQNICKSREVEPHENRNGFRKGETEGGGGEEGRAEGDGAVRRLLHPP